MESDFRFKRFAVRHSSCGMKVGTDGVLLGSWVDLTGCAKALDVGCGCGLIALMLAQRSDDCIIHAIDIDDGAVGDANYNVLNSPWPGRVSVERCDFAEFEPVTQYDIIVSNPPFFSSGDHAVSLSRGIARHETALSAWSLIKRSATLLSADGSLAMVLPCEMDDEVEFNATMSRLYPQHVTHVFSREDKSLPIRTLWQLRRKDGKCVRDSLSIKLTDNSYSTQFRQLTGEFYL